MKKTIKFIGIDGKSYTFKTCKNSLSGNQMYWIVELKDMYYGTVKDAKEIESGIKKSCVIVSEVNTVDHQLAV